MSEAYEGGFVAYLDLLVQAMLPHMEKIARERADEFAESIAADVLGHQRPTLTPDASTPNQLVLWELLREFSAVFNALEELRDFEIYVSNFPYDGTRVARSRHLQTMASSYLQAIYVLKQRINRQLNTVKRLWKASRLQPEVNRQIEPTFGAVAAALEPYTHLRGLHVHDRAFSDKDIQFVNALDFLIEHALPPGEGADLASEKVSARYEEARQRWAETVQSLNGGMVVVLDYVYHRLRQAVFSEDGSVRFPADHR